MRWPFMTRAAHDRIVKQDCLAHIAEMAVLSEAAADAVDREYQRALDAGRAQVHAWAREASWNVFHGSQAQAAFQEAIHMFAPPKTDIKEVLSSAQ